LIKFSLASNLDIIFDATVLFSDVTTNPIVMLTDIFSLCNLSLELATWIDYYFFNCKWI